MIQNGMQSSQHRKSSLIREWPGEKEFSPRFGKGCVSGSEFEKFGAMSLQICVEEERNSDFRGHSTAKNGID
jgi:hypothetical protein